jgi:aspartate/methionine/tyrosine aminotransferase
MRASYARRRQLVIRIASETGESPVHTVPPQGAFYFFLDLHALHLSSQEISERLLEEAGVGVVSGAAFGAQGEGFIRMTIAAPELDVEAGMQAILAWAEKAGG